MLLTVTINVISTNKKGKRGVYISLLTIICYKYMNKAQKAFIS